MSDPQPSPVTPASAKTAGGDNGDGGSAVKDSSELSVKEKKAMFGKKGVATPGVKQGGGSAVKRERTKGAGSGAKSPQSASGGKSPSGPRFQSPSAGKPVPSDALPPPAVRPGSPQLSAVGEASPSVKPASSSWPSRGPAGRLTPEEIAKVGENSYI